MNPYCFGYDEYEVIVLFDTKHRVGYLRNTAPFDTSVRVKDAVSGETRSYLTLNRILSDMHKYRVI